MTQRLPGAEAGGRGVVGAAGGVVRAGGRVWSGLQGVWSGLGGGVWSALPPSSRYRLWQAAWKGWSEYVELSKRRRRRRELADDFGEP